MMMVFINVIIFEVWNLCMYFFMCEGVLLVVDDVLFLFVCGCIFGLVGELGLGKFVIGFLIMGLVDLFGCVVGGEIFY